MGGRIAFASAASQELADEIGPLWFFWATHSSTGACRQASRRSSPGDQSADALHSGRARRLGTEEENPRRHRETSPAGNAPRHRGGDHSLKSLKAQHSARANLLNYHG